MGGDRGAPADEPTEVLLVGGDDLEVPEHLERGAVRADGQVSGAVVPHGVVCDGMVLCLAIAIYLVQMPLKECIVDNCNACSPLGIVTPSVLVSALLLLALNVFNVQ